MSCPGIASGCTRLARIELEPVGQEGGRRERSQGRCGRNGYVNNFIDMTLTSLTLRLGS